MADKTEAVKCDSLEAVEAKMPQIQQLLAASNAPMFGAPVGAVLAEAIVTLAAEIRRLRDDLSQAGRLS